MTINPSEDHTSQHSSMKISLNINLHQVLHVTWHKQATANDRSGGPQHQPPHFCGAGERCPHASLAPFQNTRFSYSLYYAKPKLRAIRIIGYSYEESKLRIYMYVSSFMCDKLDLPPFLLPSQTTKDKCKYSTAVFASSSCQCQRELVYIGVDAIVTAPPPRWLQ